MPKIIDKREKRAQILNVAIRIFAQRGVKNTKIADIAEVAGIGKGTVYEYFQSKDEIISASFRYFMEHVGEVIGWRVSELTDPLDKLMAYFSGWADILEGEFMGFIEVVLDFWAEGIREDKGVLAFNLAELYAEYRAVVEQLLDDCVSAGCIRPVDTRIVASVLLGTVDGLLVQWVADRNAFDIKAAVEALPDLIIYGLKKENSDED
ncbi:MAG: TetR/AcrR family transcriptional regulator [Candidatus Aminicenantaceae bacterium]